MTLSGTTSLIFLLLAGGSVALIHAILPDHWLPIALVARAQRWSAGRTTRVALWTGVGHVLGSFALGVVVIALGYGLKGILRLEGPIVGIVLVLTGLGVLLWSLAHPSHRHTQSEGSAADQSTHPDHDHPRPHTSSGHTHPVEAHGHDHRRNWGLWLIPAGIAASPDPTILPVFLAAIAVSLRTAVFVLIVYSVVTIVAMAGLTLAAAWGGYQMKGAWLEQHANQVTAAVLIALGIAAWVAF